MRIIRLGLPAYKNLRDFIIFFDQKEPDVLIVGNNGSGKSNLIEAIVTIFRDLIEQRQRHLETPFAFDLTYEIVGRTVRIEHDPARMRGKTKPSINGLAVTLEEIRDEDQPLLPKTVFAYYSGPSDRLATLFDASLVKFRNAMIAGDSAAHERLVYGRLIHSRFVLLAFLIEDDPEALKVLRDELGINDLASALFVLQRPGWERTRRQSASEKNEFWGARGIVRTFLDRLYERSLAPLQLEVPDGGILGSRTRRQRLHLYISKAETLREIVDGMRVANEPRSRTLFRLLESAFVSDLIHDVSVIVRKQENGTDVGFRELSEGEQQLLMVLGLLRFTRNEESLFLLDEPDTHLNPIWGMRLLGLIDQVVGQDATRHLLLVTHDPVAVASAKCGQVRLLSVGEDGKTRADAPDEPPEQLGVPGVLTSELFGLSSLVSPAIEDEIISRRELVALGENRTPGQDKELQKLAGSLSQVDLAATMPDPLYAEFLSRLQNRDAKLLKARDALTSAERAERDREMDEYLDEVFGKETGG